MTWPEEAISDVGSVNTGSTPKTSVPEYWGGDIPFVTPSDLGDAAPITSADRWVTEAGAQVGRLVPKDGVLVCCIGSLGKTGIAGRPIVANQQINWIDFDRRRVWPRYGYYACERLGRTLDASSASTTVPIINKSRFSQLTIPVPPLAEQRRIAAILDKADALRRKRKRALELLDTLTQSIFLDMFGGAPSDSSTSIALGDVFDFKNGVNFSSEDRGAGIPVVDVLNMYTDDIFVSTGRLYRVNLKLRDDMVLSEGDILFVRSSVKKEGVGWASLFPGSKEAMTHCGFIIRARPKAAATTFIPHFLVHFLRQPDVRNRLISSAGQVAITNINQDRLGRIQVPLVCLSDQKQFAERAQKIETQVVRCKQQIERFDIGFASLQHRAFSGQL